MHYRATSHGQTYGFDFELFGEVDVEGSKWNTKGRNIMFNIIKKDQDADYWIRLTKEKTKNPHIQIDWGKWVDEDEEDEGGADKGLSNDWDPSNMNNFNMGQYGDQGGDSDDEEEEEEEPGHVHGENCSHGDEHAHEGAKPNADLGDLDAEEEKKD